MKKRIITGSAIFLLLTIILVLRQFLTKYIFDIFILIVSSLAAVEISNCFRGDKRTRVTRNILSGIFPLVLYLSFLAMSEALVPLGWIVMVLISELLIYILICYVAIVIVHSLKNTNKEEFKIVKTLKQIMFTCFYPSCFFVFFYFVNNFDVFNTGLTASVGTLGMVLIFVISMVTDTFAMLGGMLFKGPKLCPKISPKKTISGAITGLIFGALSALAIYGTFNAIGEFNTLFKLFNIKIYSFLIFGIIGSMITQVGDIFESYFKRKLDIKDTGNILPGHGGLMDRLDGIVFNAIVIFIFFTIILL